MKSFNLDAEIKNKNSETKAISGFNNIDEVVSAAPETVDQDSTGPKRRGRKPKEENTKPEQKEIWATDARYQAFMSSAVSAGMSDVINAGFEFWARTAEDETLNLTDEEKRWWAEYFYCCSLRLKLSPDSPKFLLALGVVRLGRDIAVRYYARLVKMGVHAPELDKVLNPEQKPS